MKRATYRQLRNTLFRLSLPALSTVLAGGSWPRAQRNGARLGRIAWKLSRRDRARALRHLRTAFPDRDEDALRSIAYDSFVHLGTSFAEFLFLLRNQTEKAMQQVEIEGWEHVATAQQQPHGALIATGHCGNWELLGPAFASRQTPLAAIVRSFEEDWANELATDLRERLGTQVIRRGERDSARRLLEIFRGRGNLLILIDHDIRASSVWVPFFDKLAHTAVGPAQMAIRHSLTVIPAFCERLASGRHTIRFDEPLELPDDETEATALMTRAVENQIRRCPEQWTWMHRRWRRQPEGEEEVVRS